MSNKFVYSRLERSFKDERKHARGILFVVVRLLHNYCDFFLKNWFNFFP